MSTERRSTPAVGNEPRTEDDLDELEQDIAGGIDGEPYMDRAGWDRAHAALKKLRRAASQPAAPPINAERLARAMTDQHAVLMPDAKPMTPAVVDAMSADLAERYARLARQEAPHE